MVYSLNYRRPRRVAPDPSSGTETQRSTSASMQSRNSGVARGIPEALSFDRIIAGGVCPPCTLRDFVNYLKYIEISAENLQFFLWVRDYTKRFNELPDDEKARSPEWTHDDNQSGKVNSAKRKRGKKEDTQSIESLTGSRVDVKSLFDSGSSIAMMEDPNHAMNGTDAVTAASPCRKPLLIQPYRAEIRRIISIYIADGGARQLNLSSKERNDLLHALEHTTHPSAFQEVAAAIEWTLRTQSHPNFIRWAICNGNRPRVIFARCLGVAGIFGGLVAAILITLSSAHRAWRIISAIAFFIGISTVIAAVKGMCVVLHGMHHRHLRPWELFSSEDEPDDCGLKIAFDDTIMEEDFSNSYEDEPWVAKYEKRNFIRKVFDREVWIQEPALRQIQDTIFLQSVLGALVLTVVIVSIFSSVPNGNLY